MPGLGFSLGLAVPPLLPVGLGVPSLALAETGDNEISYTIGQVTDANQYRVEKSTDGVTYTLLATQSTHGTYTDGGLTEGQTYYYRVRSENTLTSEVSNYRVASLALLAEFSNVSLTESTTIQNSVNTLTLVFRPDVAISATGTITLSGLSGSATATNSSLTVAGAGASLFGSVGDWNNNGTLILTVASGQSVPNNSDTTITFDLTNPAFPNSGVSSVTLASSGFDTSAVSGTFFNVTESVFNGSLTFPTIQVFDTESEFIDQTDAPQYTIVHAKDTDRLCVWDGSSWYKYNNDTFSNTYSLDFDGTNDYISFANTLGIPSSTAVSMSCWINCSNTNTNQQIFGTNNKVFSVEIWGSTNVFYVEMGESKFASLSNMRSYITQGSWHHIAVVYDGSGSTNTDKIKLYIDGQLMTLSFFGTIDSAMPSFSNFYLGNGYYNVYYNGLLDECALWNNAALSANNISSIYNSGTPADISSLSPVGWWRMGDDDSGTGTTITDQGSGGNNGTLNNGPTFSTTVPS